MKTISVYILSTFIIYAIAFTACNDDSELNPKAGTLSLKITDAASDDDDIKGIYFTITDLKVDGKPVRGFQPQTIEISSLKNGHTFLLIQKELPAKEYKHLSMILKGSAIPGGSGPGCYVLTKDNTKHNLLEDGAADKEITVTGNFELEAGKETKIIVDFDLRKAIVRNESGKSNYRFVTNNELRSAIRLFKEEKTGKIFGNVNSRILYDHEIYVLIYKAGEFKAVDEGVGTGASKILFSNAVTSAKADPDGEYILPFLEEGKYDIRLAGFKRNTNNEYTFIGFLPTTSRRTGMLLNNIEVLSGSVNEVNIEVFRVL